MAFFVTSHGKLSSNETSLQATVTNQILTPQHMFALAIAGIKYLYIDEKDIAKNFQDFAHEERYARFKTIPGTLDHITVSYLFLKLSWK